MMHLSSKRRIKTTPFIHKCAGLAGCWCTMPSDYWPKWVKERVENDKRNN